jgi:hypothetical protein
MGAEHCQAKEDDIDTSRPPYIAALVRHFVDLRDGTHGGATSRPEKERLFIAAVALLDPFVRQALAEMNTHLLLDTGEVTASSIRTARGDVDAVWTLSWSEQRAVGIDPIIIRSFYGRGAHHPHLQGGTVGDWPLNVFDTDQAAAVLPTLRDIASAEIHNLVFQADYRIIPAIMIGQLTVTGGGSDR